MTTMDCRSRPGPSDWRRRAARRLGAIWLQSYPRPGRVRFGFLGFILLVGVTLVVLYHLNMLHTLIPSRQAAVPPLMQQPPAGLPIAQDPRHRSHPKTATPPASRTTATPAAAEPAGRPAEDEPARKKVEWLSPLEK